MRDSIIGLDFIAAQVAKVGVKAPKLSYITIKQRTGSIPWEKHPWEKGEQSSPTENRNETIVTESGLYNRLVVPVVVGALAVYLSALWLFGSTVKVADMGVNTTHPVQPAL